MEFVIIPRPGQAGAHPPANFRIRSLMGFRWAFLPPKSGSGFERAVHRVFGRSLWRKRFATIGFIFEGVWRHHIAQWNPGKLALLCRKCADDKKAENIVVLKVKEVSSITDYFVIATGTSEPHLRAIVDEITEKLREEPDCVRTRPMAACTGLGSD